MSENAPYYITTPIYYVNDRPHIGHCYSTTVADVAARFQRLLRGSGRDVFFLTGTDEHADKVVTSAAEHGVSPQAWADRNAEEFRKAFASMLCSNDDFIRTTEPRHTQKASAYITALLKSGDIYKGEYTGWYDAGQEEYVTETLAREHEFKSPVNGKPLIRRTEACYFFRLSKYQDALRAHIEGNARFVQPDSRRQEVLGRLRQGLNDIPVTRPVTDDPATQWGIRLPGDESHRVYVWIDALFNYLTTVDTAERRRFWPATVHLIGKDILWFHAVIWPALLLALRAADPAAYGWVSLPGTIFGHGWWVSDGQKMSKSLGNFIDLEKLHAYAGRYSLDAVRWYLVTQGPLSGADADFSHGKFVEVYNADLANGLGNCASRVSNMIEKYFGGALPEPGAAVHAGHDWPALVRARVDQAIAGVKSLELGHALAAGTELVRSVDGYINQTAPFKLAKTIDADSTGAAKAELATILFNCAEAVRIAAVLLSPAMPEKTAALLASWHCQPTAGAGLEAIAQFRGAYGLKPGQKIAKGEALFMRADPAVAAP